MKWLTFLYGGSGFVSVAYEVLWARMLSTQFGVSVTGVVVTISAFMLGLSLGSLVFAQRVAKVKNPLVILALLECGIALFAMALPWYLQLIGVELTVLATQLSAEAWQAVLVGEAFVLMTLPACAMGAGWPLIARTLGGDSAVLGKLYGINTLGAVFGSLLPLVLLPSLGWNWSIRSVAILGIGVGVGFWSLHQKKDAGKNASEAGFQRPKAWLLLTYGALGGASLMLEVAWTRLFGLIMLRTEYVLALTLAVFLAGIGLGSLVAARRYLDRWLVLLPWWCAGFILLGLGMLPMISSWVERTHWNSFGMALVMQGGLLMLVTLPVTLVLGAWFPILMQRSQSSGLWLYGVNSLGGALAAVFTGWCLIPWVGTPATLVISALAILCLGLMLSRPVKIWAAIPFLVFCVVGYRLGVMPPAKDLLPQSMAGSHDLYHYEDAVAMTQVVEQRDGQRVLLTDLQRRDASTEPTAVYVQENQSRLPLLLHSAPHTILFVGLGTGISDAGSDPYPGLDRSAVELSEGAIQAAQHWFKPFNASVLRTTRIYHDDARHFLSASRERYDVIVGDLFHPDLAGVSSLLSVQQFMRARSHLSEHGVFVQWLALNQFDTESLRVVLRSFKAVFPDAQLFMDGMHLALLGTQGPWQGVPAMLSNLQRLGKQQRVDATAGESEMTWPGRYWGPITENTSSGRMQDEWAPVIEFQLPRIQYESNAGITVVLQQLLEQRPSVELAQKLLQIPPSYQAEFQRAYIGTELLVRSWVASMQGDTVEADRLTRLAYAANPRDRWTEYAMSDMVMVHLDGAVANGFDREQLLKKLMVINPWHVEVVRALWHEQVKHQDPQANATRQRLLLLNPLDLEAQSAKN